MRGSRPGRVRLTILILSVLTIVLLSLSDAVWSTPTQAQGGTIPEATPNSGPVGAPEPTATAVAVAPIERLPPGGGRGQVGPAAGITVAAGDQSCLVIIMPGDIDIDGTIQIAPYPVDQLPNRSGAYTYIRSCEVKLFDADGNLVPYARFATTAGACAPNCVAMRDAASDDLMFGVRFAAPVDVCFPYTDADLTRVGGNPGSFVVLYYDPQAGWIELALILDPVKYIVCGAATQTGIFALALWQASTLGLPNSSGQIPEVAAAAGGSAPQAANAASTAAPSPATSATASAQSAGGAPVAEAAGGAPPVAGAAAPLATPIAAPAGLPMFWLIMLLMIVMLATLMLVLHRRSAGK